jgi:predicted AlkP superfamily pyrophosphatase or phosphodiesterase
MAKKVLWLILLVGIVCPYVQPAAAAPVPAKPKLIVALVVDQYRYDYLTRFRTDYHGGFNRLLEQGAVFTNAYLDHYPTVTAVGHSTFLTGATPALSGIVSNSWYDRVTGKTVTSVGDDETALLGGKPGQGSSPRRLRVSTVGDEMKMSGKWPTRVIGISIKDRASILPSGHMADGAFWFDSQTGNFVSSTYYFPQLPEWVVAFNSWRPADRYLGAEWVPTWGGAPLKKMAKEAGPAFYDSLPSSPYGNDLLEQFAEQAVTSLQLGGRGGIDLLTLSFSCNDYVGHRTGPDSPEVRDISIRTDQALGKLFQFLDRQVGMDKVLVVLTADHGVAPVPEVNQARKMPGGRIASKLLLDKIQAALSERYGEGQWLVGHDGPEPYLNRDLVRQKKLDLTEVLDTAADAVRELPHIFRVYTSARLRLGEVPLDPVDRRVRNGFDARRVADLFVIPDPYWMFATAGTTHGTPFNYDAHVPVIFMGPGIKPGIYHQTIIPNDIAPTLATLLEIEIPSGAVGRALAEILVQ